MAYQLENSCSTWNKSCHFPLSNSSDTPKTLRQLTYKYEVFFTLRCQLSWIQNWNSTSWHTVCNVVRTTYKRTQYTKNPYDIRATNTQPRSYVYSQTEYKLNYYLIYLGITWRNDSVSSSDSNRYSSAFATQFRAFLLPNELGNSAQTIPCQGVLQSRKFSVSINHRTYFHIYARWHGAL